MRWPLFLVIMSVWFSTSGLSAQSAMDSMDIAGLERTIAIFLGSGKTLEAAQMEWKLGLRYLYERHDVDEAIGHLLNSIYTFEHLRDSTDASRAREDLARIYAAHHYYNEALYHFDILENYYTGRKDKLNTGIIEIAIADTYTAMDSVQRAIPYYLLVEQLNAEDAIPVLTEMHDGSITALTRKGYAISGLTDTSTVDFGGLVDQATELYPLGLLNSGHRYLALGEAHLATYYYLNCIEVKNVDDVIHRDALFKLAGIYRDLQEWNTAYGYLAKYSVISDSLINDRRQRVIDRLLVTYQTYEQKSKIRELEKDQKIAAFQNRLRNVLTFSLLFGSVIVLIGAYFTIRNYQHRFNANQTIHRQNMEINRQRITELENNVKIESMNSMIQGQEAERERVAKDLHDSLGGLLSTVKLLFDAVQSQDPHVGQIQEYRSAYTLLDEACNEVRQISNNLQPSALHKLGLVPAVNDLINRVHTQESPNIEFQHSGVNSSMDSRVSLNVFRIVQELLTNALKHSSATEISIAMKQNADTLNIVVQDNGKGYEPGNTRMGMGTENIASRVNYLKGDISIHSVLGEGTTIQIDIPVR